jgi:2-iminobutanoate/2-iminopropanoate deaminase
MAKQMIHTDNAPQTLAGYSQAVKSGGFIFVSGQGPFDPATGNVVGASILEQTGLCLRNIEAILHAAGSSMDKVVSATFILLLESVFVGMFLVWGLWFQLYPRARQGAILPISP